MATANRTGRVPERTGPNNSLPKYTSIGCYPMLYLTKCGEVLCADCASECEFEDNPVVDSETNWEDACLHCDECSTRIESAYAEDEVAPEDK